MIQRRLKIAQAHQIQDLSSVPVELICASGSGIDPHINIETAYFQIPRIMKARSITGDKNKLKIYEMIHNSIDKPVGRLFGIPHVNVLILNLKLDEFQRELEKK
ncbi:MAG: potassium-transporting ATPase subunit C [Parachlamydiaceae bacterium]|nr:MAG: potassium-transporting ATPase subunit C [Parachlamydiaceae bacterium]